MFVHVYEEFTIVHVSAQQSIFRPPKHSNIFVTTKINSLDYMLTNNFKKTLVSKSTCVIMVDSSWLCPTRHIYI